MMTASDVIQVTGRLEEVGLRYWLDGGWGVDALVGEQTRPHDDLDMVVELPNVDQINALLEPIGFRVGLDHRPTRLVLSDDADQRIDLHPVVIEADGNGRQIGAGPNGGDALYPAAGLAGEGTIAGRPVRCLTPKLLLLHHTGYEPQAKDHHNVKLLCERFGLALPGAYSSNTSRLKADG
jgi:lincosamide nucleotidyltransferase A/C/D/E